jgi:hypothetical protein
VPEAIQGVGDSPKAIQVVHPGHHGQPSYAPSPADAKGC